MQHFFDLPSSLELSSDLEWMLQGGQADDVTVATALLREYYSPLAGLFKIVLEDQAAADTCLQQTFASAIAHRHTYRAEMGTRNWFYMQALRVFQSNDKRLYFQQRFKKYTRIFQKPQPASSTTSEDPDAVWIENFQHLEQKNRMLIFLHLGVGFSYDDLAKIYRQPAETLQGALMGNLAHLFFLACKTAGQGKRIPIDHFKENLTRALQNSQTTHSLSETEISLFAASISKPEARQSHTAVRSLRELALGGAVLLAAAFIWFFGSVLDGGSAAQTLSKIVAGVNPSPTARITRPPRPTYTPRISPTVTPTVSPTFTPTVEPTLPSPKSLIDFSKYKIPAISLADYYGVNNSGNVALSLALQSLGWHGDVNGPRRALQPNDADHTVLPYEILTYVNEKTGYRALTRLDGDVGLVCDLAKAGYPIILERGITRSTLDSAKPDFVIGFEGFTVTITDTQGINPIDAVMATIVVPQENADPNEWFGVYEILAGCDERKTAMYVWRPLPMGIGRYRVPAYEFDSSWWNFGNQYIVVYAQEKETDLLAILAGQGKEYAKDQSVEIGNYINAVETTSYRVYSASTPLESFFTWYNRGTALTYLDDYAWAAAAFDMAFEIYQGIPENERPWRITWYNTRSYWAYFYSEQYQKVIDLTTQTLATPGGNVLEESYYWRALAREATGDKAGALTDMQTAVEINRMFAVAIEQLARMKSQP
jgi:DNA-directed RNA polymerase specialized sigma24 family protein